MRSPINIFSWASAAVSVAADQSASSLVAAPGVGKAIWVYGALIVADTADGTIKLSDSTPTDFTGAMGFASKGGFVLPLVQDAEKPYYKCAENKALTITTVTAGCDGSIHYAIVKV